MASFLKNLLFILLIFLNTNFSYGFSRKKKEKKQEDKITIVRTGGHFASGKKNLDYFSHKKMDEYASSGKLIVLFASGMSDSTHFYRQNLRVKTLRGFTMHYLWALRLKKMGGKPILHYITPIRVDMSYRRYLYAMAMGTYLGFERFDKEVFKEHFFSTTDSMRKKGGPTPSEVSGRMYWMHARNINAFQKLVRTAQKHKKRDHVLGLTAHSTGVGLQRLAEELEVDYLVNSATSKEWINKSHSRLSFKESSLLHPDGSYEPRHTVELLAKDIAEVFKRMGGDSGIVKLQRSAAGDGNKVISFKHLKKEAPLHELSSDIKAIFSNEDVFSKAYMKRMETYGAIFEERIQGKNFTSPATIVHILDRDKVEIRYAYEQLLAGEDFQRFQGSLGQFLAPEDYKKQFHLDAITVAKYLSRKGVRGNVGTDFVIVDADENSEGRTYSIENNVRGTGTMYPFNAVSMLVDEEYRMKKFMLSNDGVKIESLSERSYQRFTRNGKNRHTLGVNAFLSELTKEFYEHLAKHPLRLRVESTERYPIVKGCYVHGNTLALGKVGVTCLGETREETQKISQDFTDSLKRFIDRSSLVQKHLKKFREIKTTKKN